MKEIDVYFEDKIVKSIVCDRIIPDFDCKNWLVYDKDNLVGSIPMNYLIIKK